MNDPYDLEIDYVTHLQLYRDIREMLEGLEYKNKKLRMIYRQLYFFIERMEFEIATIENDI